MDQKEVEYALKEYFNSERRRILSISEIERLANAPKGTITYFLNGRRSFPLHHFENIRSVLYTIGYCD
jgi:hypothetical protein